MKIHEDYLTNLFAKNKFILGQEINEAVETHLVLEEKLQKKLFKEQLKKV